MNISIEDKPEYHVVGLRHNGAYWKIGGAFGELSKWKAGHPLQTLGAIAVFHDDPEKVSEASLRSDALYLVAEFMEAPEGMIAYTIPAARYLIGEYVGSYEGLPQAWGQFFGQELPKQNVVPCEGYTFKLYLNHCHDTPDKLRTELYVPIAKE